MLHTSHDIFQHIGLHILLNLGEKILCKPLTHKCNISANFLGNNFLNVNIWQGQRKIEMDTDVK